MAPMQCSVASRASSFNGVVSAFSKVSVSRSVRVCAQPIEAKRVCQVTGAKRNKANKVCFSAKKSRTFQQVNLLEKKVFWEAGNRWVSLKLSARALRTIEKNGIEAVAKKYGLDLKALPYTDVSPARLQWKADNGSRPPLAKNPRQIKNAAKIAASKKGPMSAEYCFGKIRYFREDKN